MLLFACDVSPWHNGELVPNTRENQAALAAHLAANGLSLATPRAPRQTA